MGRGAGGAAGRAGRGAGLLGLLGLLGVLGGRAAPRGARGMGLVLPLYNHKFDSDWAAVADAAGRVPLIAVVAAAPSREPSAELARNAQALRDAGATVLWYVYTRNGSVPCCECCEDLAPSKAISTMCCGTRGTASYSTTSRDRTAARTPRGT